MNDHIDLLCGKIVAIDRQVKELEEVRRRVLSELHELIPIDENAEHVGKYRAVWVPVYMTDHQSAATENQVPPELVAKHSKVSWSYVTKEMNIDTTAYRFLEGYKLKIERSILD